VKEKFIRFMYGRYGMDSFGKFTIIAGLVTMILAGWNDSLLLSLVSWTCIVYSYFRMFSKNIYKRSSENQWYLNKTYKLRQAFYKQKNLMLQRKTHHIYKCPTCRQKIRIPRGKGRIEIRCPKCSSTFIKNS
jgi:DNA-directed RNA polymerase subunit RPC12/RpoP